MHRRTNNFNYRDIIVSSDHKITRVLLPILGIATSLGLSTLLSSQSAYATGSELEIIVPDAAIENKATINPSAIGSSFASVYVPVGINATGVSTAELFVTTSDQVHSATTDLVNTTDDSVRIATLPLPSPAPSSLSPLNYTGITKEEFINDYSYNNRWGYRATLVKADADIVSSQSTINSLAGTSSNYRPTTSSGTAGSVLSNLSSLSSSTVINTANNKTWGSIIADTGDLGNETFYPIMSHIDAEPMRSFIGTSTAGSYSGLLTLELALKLDSSIPNGTYEGNIMVSAIANPRQTIFDLEYMQDMEDYICEATTTPSKDATTSNANKTATYTPGENGKLGTWTVTPVADFIEQQDDDSYVPETILIDKRDNKPYLIRKLADGNCWMSQNLRFDFLTEDGGYADDNATPATYVGVIGGTQLTQDDTDINDAVAWSIEYFREKYPGKDIFATQQASHGGNWGQDGGDGLRSFSTLQAIPNTSFLVKKETGDGNFSYETKTTGTLQEYAGNVYNWTAATLYSRANSAVNGFIDSKNSICPRGWRLPDQAGNKSLANLLANTYFSEGMSDSEKANIATEFPLDMHFTGNYYYQGGFGTYASRGFWWVKQGLTGTRAYNVQIDNTPRVLLQNNFYRGDGYAVRCIAK